MRPQQGSGVYMTASSATAALLQQQHQQQQRFSAAYGNPNMTRAMRPSQGPTVVHIPSGQAGSIGMDNNEWRQHLMMNHATAASHQARPSGGGFLHQAQGSYFSIFLPLFIKKGKFVFPFFLQ